MKYSFLLSLIIFISVSCNKDNVETDRDIESFSSTSFKKYDTGFEVNDVLLTENDALIIVGNGKDGNGSRVKPFVLQLDDQKEISWLNFINISPRNVYREINVFPTVDEKYMVLSNSVLEFTVNSNIDITKIRQDGSVDWNKRFVDEDNSLTSTSLVQLPNEDYIIYSEIQQGGFSLINQLQLSRISGSGELIWTQLIDSVDISGSRQLVYFPENNCVIGLSEDGLGFNNGIIKLHKFDLEGNIIWGKTIMIPGSLDVSSSNIIKTVDEDIMLTYSSNSRLGGSDYDIILIKMDQEGNSEWKKTYSGSKLDVSKGIIQTEDGNFMLLSNTTSFGNGSYDVMLSKIDQTGELIWEKVYGSSAFDSGKKVVEKSNGNLMIIGTTNEGVSNDNDFIWFVLETDQEGTPL